MNEELLYGGAEGMETFGAIAGMLGTISVEDIHKSRHCWLEVSHAILFALPYV